MVYFTHFTGRFRGDFGHRDQREHRGKRVVSKPRKTGRSRRKNSTIVMKQGMFYPVLNDRGKGI